MGKLDSEFSKAIPWTCPRCDAVKVTNELMPRCDVCGLREGPS